MLVATESAEHEIFYPMPVIKKLFYVASYSYSHLANRLGQKISVVLSSLATGNSVSTPAGSCQDLIVYT